MTNETSFSSISTRVEISINLYQCNLQRMVLKKTNFVKYFAWLLIRVSCKIIPSSQRATILSIELIIIYNILCRESTLVGQLLGKKYSIPCLTNFYNKWEIKYIKNHFQWWYYLILFFTAHSASIRINSISFPPINLYLIDLADLKYSFTVKPECSRPKSHAGEKYHMHSKTRKMEA